ncbi:hypothetical protein OIO90_005775 [Microbotryomycetes sp. JL221]|nr:hypothetical protein OIO90_005775 [Microbotryomycetes sp. JL221]
MAPPAAKSAIPKGTFMATALPTQAGMTRLSFASSHGGQLELTILETASCHGADDSRYKMKYVELKTKLRDLEDDNSILALKVLQNKKAIQRLRLQRAILYDRLQQTTVPTNPYALKTVEHLLKLAQQQGSARDPAAPDSILDEPKYTTSAGNDLMPRDTFLRQLDETKIKLVKHNSQAEFGQTSRHGVKGEQDHLNGDQDDNADGDDSAHASATPAAATATNGDEQKPDQMQVD